MSIDGRRESVIGIGVVKELELSLRVRNNRLKERREELGLSQAKLAEKTAMSLNNYCGLETMRVSPWDVAHDCWRDFALRLASFHCVEPEELFPQAVLSVKAPTASRRINSDELLPLISEHQGQRLLGEPGDALGMAQTRELVRRAVAVLARREALALRLRFGLDDGVERTLREVGDELGTGAERARQYVEKALIRLASGTVESGDSMEERLEKRVSTIIERKRARP